MRPLRALFLDVGHTLLREVPSRHAIYAEVARAEGVAMNEAGMRAHMRRAHDALPERLDGHYRYSDPWFRRFIARIFGDELGLSPARVEAVTEALFERFEDPANFRPYPGAEALLDDTRAAGLTLGVVSNWSSRLPRLLDAMGLASRLDVMVVSALEGLEKPDPALFALALERAGVEPSRAAHAGDRLDNDVRGARAAGLHAILVDHAGASEDAEVAAAGGTRVPDLPGLRAWILERCA